MALDEANTYTPKKAIPPFLTTLGVVGKNLHNCMMDSGAGANITPYKVCKALNFPIVESLDEITQLDNTLVKVMGMIHNLCIQIALQN